MKDVVGHAALIITRPVEWGTVLLGFEQANRYTVYDEAGEIVAHLLEEEGSLGRAVGRQLFKTRRSFTATVLNPAGDQVIFRLRRPMYLISSTMYIEDGSGERVGEVQQSWHLWRRRYELFMGQRQFAAIDGGFLAWEFEVKDERGGTLALIDRNFSGFGKELFTDAGRYAVHFGGSATEAAHRLRTSIQAAHPDRPSPPITALAKLRTDAAVIPTQTGDQLVVARPLALDERMVALAAAISIDYDFFSRHSAHGGGLFSPYIHGPIIPFPSSAVYGEEESGEGSAGEGEDGETSGETSQSSESSGGGQQQQDPLERNLGGDEFDWGGGGGQQQQNESGGGGDGGGGWGWGGDDDESGGGDDGEGGGNLSDVFGSILGWGSDD